MNSNIIPEFILKLYHILENDDFKLFISWNGDKEFVIKNIKKLQEKVLPMYFRHKKISSFIRQLNLYQFKKIDKSLSEKSKFMYFQNPFFIRGQKSSLQKIKRNNKKKQNMQSQKFINDDDGQVSFVQNVEENEKFIRYQSQVKKSFSQVKQNLRKMIQIYPDTIQFRTVLNICNQFLSNHNQDSEKFMNMNSSFNYFNQQNFIYDEVVQEQKSDLKKLQSTSEKMLPFVQSFESRPSIFPYFMPTEILPRSNKSKNIFPKQFIEEF